MILLLVQLQALTERLHKINEAIAQKIAARDDYDKTVRETESAYMKVCFLQCILLE